MATETQATLSVASRITTAPAAIMWAGSKAGSLTELLRMTEKNARNVDRCGMSPEAAAVVLREQLERARAMLPEIETRIAHALAKLAPEVTP